VTQGTQGYLYPCVGCGCVQAAAASPARRRRRLLQSRAPSASLTSVLRPPPLQSSLVETHVRFEVESGLEAAGGGRAWEALQAQVQRVVTGVASGALLATMRLRVSGYAEDSSRRALADTVAAEFFAPAELAVKVCVVFCNDHRP
jgi:hypothetical protein